MAVPFYLVFYGACGLLACTCSHTQDAGKASPPPASVQSRAKAGEPAVPPATASNQPLGAKVHDEPAAGPAGPAATISHGTGLAPVAVVELFTSEGCSSCPSADRALADIEERRRREGQNVIALAFHVDYWNRLGWRDRFSRRAYSDRQRWYAQHEPEPRVYTPQMIVQGREEFIGSHREVAQRAIEKALSEPARAGVALESHGLRAQRWQTSFAVERAKPEDHLTLALLQSRATSRVSAGENAGRTLKHVNIVVDYAQKRVASGRGSWNPEYQPGVDLVLVAVVQDQESLEVLGAKSLLLTP